MLIRFGVIIVWLLALSENCNAQEIKYWRLGIGYQPVEESTTLSKPLSHMPSKNYKPASVTLLPEACFKKPGITSVSGYFKF